MNITGSITRIAAENPISNGCFSGSDSNSGRDEGGSGGLGGNTIRFDASKNWTGETQSSGSHTHSVSGSTGPMNQNAKGSVWSNQEGLFNGRVLKYNGNIKLSGGITWAGGDNEDKNCPTTMTIDVSHTHSFSGSTGGMNSHSSGYMAGIIDNSDGITYDNDVFTNSGKGTYLGRRDFSYAYITKVTLNVSHTHSFSGSTGGMSGYDYATWRISCKYANSGIRLTATDYSNHKNSDDAATGRVVDFNLDLSHTHSLSGSTGGMNQNATGYAYMRPPTNKGNIGSSGCFNWDNATIDAENEDGSNGRRRYKLNIDVSHTHSLSGSTGEMSKNSFFNHGGHTIYNSNSINVTNVGGLAEHYNHSASGRHDGQVYSIDVSHTHSVSGSTGKDGYHRHVFSADNNANHSHFQSAGDYNTSSAKGKGGGYGAYTTYSGSHTRSLSGLSFPRC